MRVVGCEGMGLLLSRQGVMLYNWEPEGAPWVRHHVCTMLQSPVVIVYSK